MNHEKTGALIAKRRGELGLTQKALAERLNISDRAVSRWERGLGFPDISLIEAVADALNLTVLELLHGEEEPPTPEEERSARETLNNIRPEVHEKMKKTRRWIVILTAVIVLLLAALAIFLGLVNAAESYTYMSECTAAEATATSPYALITQNEFALIRALNQDEKVLAKMAECAEYKETYGEAYYLHYEDKMDEEFCGDYFRKFILPVRNLDFYHIYVYDYGVLVQYGTKLLDCYLDMDKNGVVSKTVNAYETSWLTEDGQIITDVPRLYQVVSFDNDRFRMSYRKTGLAALFG